MGKVRVYIVNTEDVTHNDVNTEDVPHNEIWPEPSATHSEIWPEPKFGQSLVHTVRYGQGLVRIVGQSLVRIVGKNIPPFHWCLAKPSTTVWPSTTVAIPLVLGQAKHHCIMRHSV